MENYSPDDDYDNADINEPMAQVMDDGLPSDNIEIENAQSQVASAPTKNILIMAILGIASIIFLYNMIFKEEEGVKEQKKLAEIEKSQPVELAQKPAQAEEESQTSVGFIGTPDLPDIEGLQPLPPPSGFDEAQIDFPNPFGDFEPPIEEKIEPKKAPTKPEVVKVAAPIIEKVAAPVINDPKVAPVIVVVGPSAAELASRKANRRKSGMLMMNGGGRPSEKTGTDGDSDPNLEIILSNKLSRTSAAQVTATKIGNTNYLIAQGKMINAVLETAINTDLPGSLRAVISRDVYAETGNIVLIPRGSRLIGGYDNNIEVGQKRIVVSWNRVIRPDGVDIAIDSPGTDQLGRAGITGLVDNKYFEMFSNSLLISAISIGGTILLDKVKGTQSTSSSTTTNTSGATTSSSSGAPTDLAVLDSVSNLGDVASNIAKRLGDQQPTIIVDQGSRIKVFVNKDLIFPRDSINDVNFID